MSPAINARMTVGRNKKHQSKMSLVLCYVLLRATATVGRIVTRDVDETASIDNQPRKFTCLPGCLFLIALIIPYVKMIVQPFCSVWSMNLAQMYFKSLPDSHHGCLFLPAALASFMLCDKCAKHICHTT